MTIANLKAAINSAVTASRELTKTQIEMELLRLAETRLDVRGRLLREVLIEEMERCAGFDTTKKFVESVAWVTHFDNNAFNPRIAVQS